MRKYLINFSRSFIYTTALPEVAVQTIIESYGTFPFLHNERKQLHTLIENFQRAEIFYRKLTSNTPIQIVIIPGNENVKSVAAQLQQNNFDVRAIMYPTVPKEEERLRIVLHSFNSKEEISRIVTLLQ